MSSFLAVIAALYVTMSVGQCRTCKEAESFENEQHLLQCKMLKDEIKQAGDVQFKHIFEDINKQKIALAAFKAVLRKREVLLKLQENH